MNKSFYTCIPDIKGTKGYRMKRRDFLKNMSGVAAAFFIGYNHCFGQESNNLNEDRLVNPNRKWFKKIEWRLGDQKIYDWNSIKLEELVFTNETPLNRDLTEWEMPALSRLIPIKKLIEQHSDFYAIHPMWATMFFHMESALDPCAVNSNYRFEVFEDCGLGQIKLGSENIAESLGTHAASMFLSPYLDANKSIFDPEKNIIMSMLLNRFNIGMADLANSDQVYAVYVRGVDALDDSREVNETAINLVQALQERYEIYRPIIPLFRLSLDEVNAMNDGDAKSLLEISLMNLGPEQTYQMELDYMLKSLENDPNGSVRNVLTYEDSVRFAETLQNYGTSQKDAYNRLWQVGLEIETKVEEPELKNRMIKSKSLVYDAMNQS